MQIVELPDGREVEFPDGMDVAAMQAAIHRNFPEFAPKAAAAPAPAPVADTGLLGSAMAAANVPVRVAVDRPKMSVTERLAAGEQPPVPSEIGMMTPAKWADVQRQQKEDPLDPRLVDLPTRGIEAKAQQLAARQAAKSNGAYARLMAKAREDNALERKMADTYSVENLAGNTAKNLRNTAASALKIGPTAIKGAADVARLLSGDTIGKDASESLAARMKVIDEVVAHASLTEQGKEFGALMKDPNASVGDLYGYLLDNPELLVDQGITTIGSMFLPAGAAMGAVKAGKVAGLGVNAVRGAATAASMGTVAAQNAADTFTSDELKDAGMGDRYKAATVSAAISMLAGIATKGGADGTIARRLAGELSAGRTSVQAAKKFIVEAAKEGVQEAGEEFGGAAGEAVGTLSPMDPNNTAKRMAFAATLGAVMGGGSHLATDRAAVDDGSAAAEAARQAALGKWNTQGLRPGTVRADGRREPTWSEAANPAPPAPPAPTAVDIMEAGSVDEAIAAAQAMVSTPHATPADIDALEDAAFGLPANPEAGPGAAADVANLEPAAPVAAPEPGVWGAAAAMDAAPAAPAVDEDSWHAFPPETGTLGIPRADMPQIKAEHRGAMTQFLGARGITHEQVELSADELKPTQAEFSLGKVQKAIDYVGGNRSILVSSDGHVLDGHHQWLASAEKGEPVKAIRLNAPIAQLLETVKEFPSATKDDASAPTPAATGMLGQAAPKPAPTKAGDSWVIRNKATGEVIAETYDRKKVDALNTEKYEAVPARQHLEELNDPESLAGKAMRAGGITLEDARARNQRQDDEVAQAAANAKIRENSPGSRPDAAWRTTEFAPRIAAMADELRAAGDEGMARAIENGAEADAVQGRLTDASVSFRENKARQALAKRVAAGGGTIKQADIEPMTFEGMLAKTNTAGALPRPIVDAAVKKWNAIAPELAKLGYKDGEAHTDAPTNARDLQRQLKEIINALDSLAARRYQHAKGHKNANPDRLKSSEDAASAALGIKTRKHQGIDTSNPITLGKGVSDKSERSEDAKAAAKRLRERIQRDDPFLAFLGNHGVAIKDRADIGLEKGNKGTRMVPGYGPVLRHAGKRLDELALLAKDEGFLTQQDIDSDMDTGGTRKLADMIQRAVAGKEVIRPAGMLEASAPTSDDRLLAEAASLDIDTTGKTAEQVYDEVVAAHAELEARRDAIDADSVEEQAEVESLADTVDTQLMIDADIPLDGGIFASDNQTEEELDAIFGPQSRGSAQDPAGEAESDAGAPARESAQGTGAAREGEGEDLLSSYTPSDVRARQDADDAREKASQAERDKLEAQRKKARDDADIRARQDASADNFQLGQDAMDSLAGQGDIFSQPAPAAAPRDRFGDRNNTSVKDINEQIDRETASWGFAPGTFDDATFSSGRLSPKFPKIDKITVGEEQGARGGKKLGDSIWLAQGPNGNWGFGLDIFGDVYGPGQKGLHTGLTPDGRTQYKTRQAAIDAALERIKAHGKPGLYEAMAKAAAPKKTEAEREREMIQGDSAPAPASDDDIDAMFDSILEEVAPAPTPKTPMQMIAEMNENWRKFYFENQRYFTGDGKDRKLTADAPQEVRDGYADHLKAKKAVQDAYDGKPAAVAAEKEKLAKSKKPRPAAPSIPLAFYKKVKVDQEVMIEGEGVETIQVPADEALASVADDINNLEALMKCMKG